MTTSEASQFDICIIGAGLAGLRAAQLLLRNRHSNFVVVEARDRVGGRVCCVPLRNTDDFIDLGAHFVHGMEGNPLYAMASESDDIIVHFSEDAVDAELYFTPDGTKLDEKGSEEFSQLFEAKLSELTEDSSLCSKKDVTVADMLDSLRSQLKLDESSDKLSANHKRALFDFFSLCQCLDSGCDKASSLAASGFHDYEDCEGEPYINLKNGFSSILKKVAADVTPAVVRRNTVASKIEYSESGCRVSVTPKGKVPYVISAKHVLCTLPLGCLKANSVSFSPPLPDGKQTAIQSLGFGLIDRLLFFCERRWWPRNATGFAMFIVWTEETKNSFTPTCQDPALYQNPEDMAWYRNILAFDVESTVDTPIIVAFAAGHWAKVIEQLPDKEVLGVVGEMVTKILGPHFENQPKPPVGMIRSKWAADPYSLGSYSHVPPGSSAAMFDTLAQPLPSPDKPRLLFAGEATHSSYFSAAHAAWLSADREVDRIISNLK